MIVYTSRGARPGERVAAFGCLRRLGRRYRIDQRRHSDEFNVFRPAGPFVVTVASNDAQEGDFEQSDELALTMTDLRSGRLYRLASGLIEGSSGFVFAVVTKRNGSTAYIERFGFENNYLWTCEIDSCYTAAGRAFRSRVIDRGDIPPDTLRLEGSQLTWRNGDLDRTATLR